MIQVLEDDSASYQDWGLAAKFIVDRAGLAPGLKVEAQLEHRVPGWERVIKNMFSQPQAIEAAEPSLSDLKDAYERRGMTDPDRCRSHAVQVLGREVESAYDLSPQEIGTLLRALAPSYGDGEVIEAEVIEADRSNPPIRSYEQRNPTADTPMRRHPNPDDERLPEAWRTEADRPSNRARLYR